jgi:hypothetical protein
VSPVDDGSQTSRVFRDVEESPSEGELQMNIEDIDLRALAEEVYVLLRQELRLERERRGWRRDW